MSRHPPVHDRTPPWDAPTGPVPPITYEEIGSIIALRSAHEHKKDADTHQPIIKHNTDQ